jgi:hypothetical protein
MDALGARPATARRRVRGRLHGDQRDAVRGRPPLGFEACPPAQENAAHPNIALRPACANASARREKALGRRAEGRPKAFGLPAA